MWSLLVYLRCLICLALIGAPIEEITTYSALRAPIYITSNGAPFRGRKEPIVRMVSYGDIVALHVSYWFFLLGL